MRAAFENSGDRSDTRLLFSGRWAFGEADFFLPPDVAALVAAGFFSGDGVLEAEAFPVFLDLLLVTAEKDEWMRLRDGVFPVFKS